MTHADLITRLRSQKTTDEMERHEVINADFEGAYDLLIRDCRTASDALTAAQERIEALEGALRRVSTFPIPRGFGVPKQHSADAMRTIARAALDATGKGEYNDP